jgi:hypothetical protein
MAVAWFGDCMPALPERLDAANTMYVTRESFP